MCCFPNKQWIIYVKVQLIKWSYLSNAYVDLLGFIILIHFSSFDCSFFGLKWENVCYDSFGDIIWNWFFLCSFLPLSSSFRFCLKFWFFQISISLLVIWIWNWNFRIILKLYYLKSCFSFTISPVMLIIYIVFFS